MTDEEQELMAQMVEVLRINTENIATLTQNVTRLIDIIAVKQELT